MTITGGLHKVNFLVTSLTVFLTVSFVVPTRHENSWKWNFVNLVNSCNLTLDLKFLA